jgi:hypothetical protein
MDNLKINQSSTLLVKAQLVRMNRLADNTVNFGFHSMEEISNDDFALADHYFKKDGWMAFKSNMFDINELPQENAQVEGGKTPSQHLRACLWVKHIKSGGTKETFPDYYVKAMAGFAEAVKRTIPED